MIGKFTNLTPASDKKIIAESKTLNIKNVLSINKEITVLYYQVSFCFSIYKNGISCESGWNPAIFDWLRREGERMELSDEDKWGGIMFDEMTIQVNTLHIFALCTHQNFIPGLSQYIWSLLSFGQFLFF